MVIATQLYAALRADGARQVGWKLGLTDEGGQRRLGAAGPFVAPIFDTTRLFNGATVSLARFTQPRVEVEIGFALSADGITVLPCIEIADCHFPGWRIALGPALADFGLHGAALFGEPAGPADAFSDVTVSVSHDGRQLLEGSTEMQRAVELAVRLAPAYAGDTLVASGRITDLVPLEVGEWTADFGALGKVELTVGP
jgi:2-keto-4-pentenoate hydratase